VQNIPFALLLGFNMPLHDVQVEFTLATDEHLLELLAVFNEEGRVHPVHFLHGGRQLFFICRVLGLGCHPDLWLREGNRFNDDIGFLREFRVSLVMLFFSLMVAPISPATSFSTLLRFLPYIAKSWLRRPWRSGWHCSGQRLL
jgi:hypothetical protein